MNGWDIQRYDSCQMKAVYFGFRITAHGERIALYCKKGNLLGMFDNIDHVFHYLCGVDAGMSIEKENNTNNDMYWKDRYMKAKDLLKDALMLLPCETQEQSAFISAIGNEINNDNDDKG